MRLNSPRRLAVCLLTALAAAPAALAVPTPTVENIVGGIGFDGPPALNDSGYVVYERNGVYYRSAIGVPVKRVVGPGDISPDANGSFSNIYNALINENAQVAFWAGLSGTSNSPFDDTGIFFNGGPGGMVQVVREDDPVPEGNGNFNGFSPRGSLNDLGQVAFSSQIRNSSGGSSDWFGVYRADSSSVTNIARAGTAAPDANGSLGEFYRPSLNNAGQVAFVADITGTSGGSSDDMGIFMGDGTGGVIRIARKGQATPSSGVFSGFGDLNFGSGPVINDAGQVAFFANVTSSSPPFGDGIFLSDGVGPIVQIARRGDILSNGRLDSFTQLSLNNNGVAAFRATMFGTSGAGTDNIGIFFGDGSAVATEVIREGDAPPEGNGVYGTFGAPVINDAGQVAFFASLSGTTNGSNDDTGIYFYDPVHGLLTVAREGETLFGSTVVELDFLGEGRNASDEGNGINESDQIAFYYRLANADEGIALYTVPEPSSLALLGLGGLLVARRRRR